MCFTFPKQNKQNQTKTLARKQTSHLLTWKATWHNCTHKLNLKSASPKKNKHCSCFPRYSTSFFCSQLAASEQISLESLKRIGKGPEQERPTNNMTWLRLRNSSNNMTSCNSRYTRLLDHLQFSANASTMFQAI